MRETDATHAPTVSIARDNMCEPTVEQRPGGALAPSPQPSIHGSGRELHDGPGAHEAIQDFRSVLDRGIPFRVRENRSDV